MSVRVNRWEPENIIFWLTRGRAIARRNLSLSVLSLHLNFNVYMMWSMVVVNLPQIGFSLTASQQFVLCSIPPFVGAWMRIIYASIWSWTGGGMWLGISTGVLLIPAVMVSYIVQDISTPYYVLVLVGAFCGLGGAASSSHLSNTSFFFPKASKGLAMGINAGMGNLGVSTVQMFIPLIILVPILGADQASQVWGLGAEVKTVWLQNAGLIWIPFIIIISTLCFLYAHDLPKLKLTPKDQYIMMKEPHTWYICLLYLGSYGTFIGFSAVFPLLSRTMFPLEDATPYLFVGPMLAALSRPIGGWCGDRIGGGVTSMVCYILMGIATLALLLTLPKPGELGSFLGFLALSQIIFFAAGVGNGSSYQLSPKVFMQQAMQEEHAQDNIAQAMLRGSRRGVAAMGISSVAATFGGFFIPNIFALSDELFSSYNLAFIIFLIFYMLCAALAWYQYTRPSAKLRC